MIWRPVFLTAFTMTLSGCSYVYDLMAVVHEGQLMITLDSDSPRHPDCFRAIEVVLVERRAVEAEPDDDRKRTGYGTVWRDEVEYDDECKNRFPFTYGHSLNGKQRPDFGLVQPKPLSRNIVYDVATQTGATGYGSGRFIIRADGRVENLPAL